MRVKVRVRKERTNIQGLNDAPRILSRNVRKGLESIGKRFVQSSQSRMREDTGASKKSLRVVITGRDLDLSLLVFSTLVQAMIDARGLPRGTFPPHIQGTPLYNWARRRMKGIAVAKVKRGRVPKRTLYQLNRNWERRRRIRKLRGVPRVKTINRAKPIGNRRTRRIENDTKRIAYLAARAIFRKGIRATHWNTKALEANKARIVREISNSILRATVEMKRK